jgi:HEAT repeat protein
MIQQYRSADTTEHQPRHTAEEANEVEEAEEAILPTQAERDAMRLLIRRVGRRSVLQKSVLAELGASKLPASTVRALVTLLQGPFSERWRERVVALWALGCADLAPNHRNAVSEAIQEALGHHPTRPDLALVNSSANAWKRTRPLAALAGAAGFLWAMRVLCPPDSDVVFSILPGLFSVMISGVFGSVTAVVASYLLFPAVLPVSYGLDRAQNQRVRAAAALALGRLGHPQSVGALARAALELSPTVRQAAETALHALLPTLTPDDYGRLDANACPSLCRLLNVRRQQLFADHVRTEDLVVELLAALGKVGDGRAIPVVEAVAVDGWTERARQAARAALPALQARRQNEQNHRLLLRGAVAPVTPETLLLRSVSRDAASEPDTLLRALNDASDR